MTHSIVLEDSTRRIVETAPEHQLRCLDRRPVAAREFGVVDHPPDSNAVSLP